MEVFPHSTYYGATKIFRRYASLPSLLPFPAQVQHGWYFDPAVQTRCDVIQAPAIWCWSDRIRKFIADAYPSERPVTVGAPFLYSLRLLDYKETAWSKRRGSIVFPCHSSELLRVSCDFEKYASDLYALPLDYHPISVCIYYKDNHPAVVKPFIEHGFEIINNGQGRTDEQFLYNFVRNAQEKRYAFSNQMTSALLFACTLGLHAFIYGPTYTLRNLGNKLWDDTQLNDYFQRWISDYSSYFLYPTADLDAQRKFTAEELGANSLLDPSAMKRHFKELLFTQEYRSHLFKRCLKTVAAAHEIFAAAPKKAGCDS